MGSLPWLRHRKKDIPGDLWVRCASCNATVFGKDLDDQLKVCPECGQDLCRACAQAGRCTCQTKGENHDPEPSPVAGPDPGDETDAGGDEEPEFFIVHASELEEGDATDEAA